MRNETSDDDWKEVRANWQLASGVTYLNHGSFGPPPLPVQAARAQWQQRMDAEPMDFFVRQFQPAWEAARDELAGFVGTAAGNIVFTENATAAMNVIAHSFPLAAGDSVLLNDHEYGAVERVWQRRCAAAGAAVHSAKLPARLESAEQVVEAIFAAVDDSTRLIIVSHITSPTAIALPVQQICQRARDRQIAVCIDGPHAVAQLPLHIDSLDCDFYAASCHKWLSASFGTGFLYVAPRWQPRIQPTSTSWGLLLPARPEKWSDEFVWSGTRDPAPYLSIPAAIRFLSEHVGLDAFRRRIGWLARYARQRLIAEFGFEPLVPDDPQWYTSMAHVPLPAVNARQLQNELWEQFAIEVPIIDFGGRQFVRVSCHLYNSCDDIERLITALRRLILRSKS